MSNIRTKKISIMASHDWTLRRTLTEFIDFINPVFKWNGHDYQIQLDRVIARPIQAGSDVAQGIDLIVDRTTHWNPYYKYWGHQAINSLARIINHTFTFSVYDKHATYDLMARFIHPSDRFPKTVLIPQFNPWTPDQVKDYWWKREQELIIQNTRYGFDEKRRQTDWQKVRHDLQHEQRFYRRSQIVREQFYYSGEYLKEVVADVFENKFPLYLKKAFGGGGSKVFKIHDLDELYEKYDQTGDESYHIQEGIDPYDFFYRAMGIGPIVFPMRFQPDEPHFKHYSEEKVVMDREMFQRLETYVLFINAYHRWTYNSFESLLKDGKLHPIDFANACPDSQFLSLHVHFPLLVCNLLKWLAFCAVTEKDMRIDMEMTKCLKILNNPDIPQEEKYGFARKYAEDYFEIEKFQEFCALNCGHYEEQMIHYYDRHFDEIIRYSLEFSDFPPNEYDKFYAHYKHLMENIWRPNAAFYLQPQQFIE